MCDCETLIKAIHASQHNPFEKFVESRVRDTEANNTESWCELRHYLGRLHSYRQASEVITTMLDKWPDLFSSPKISYILPAPPKRIPVPRSALLSDIIPIALPGYTIFDIESDIAELEGYGLHEEIREQLEQRTIMTLIHGEIQLHDHLVRQGKTKTSDFWSNSMFVATSKPTCRLCYYYFNCPTNDFHIQTTHMNIYPKWRLPDIYEHQGEEAKEQCEEVLQYIIEQMRHDLLETFREKFWKGKRNDSRTDSYRPSTRATSLPEIRSRNTNIPRTMRPTNRFRSQMSDVDEYESAGASHVNYQTYAHGLGIGHAE